MTDFVKGAIRRMRRQGSAYKEIAAALEISEATVKTFCRRNHLQDTDLQTFKSAREDFAVPAVCAQCGRALVQGEQSKARRFCSDQCRLAWWNSHRDKVTPKNTRRLVCAACGREFQSYCAERKYCSHACYIKARFGGERNDGGSV